MYRDVALRKCKELGWYQVKGATVFNSRPSLNIGLSWSTASLLASFSPPVRKMPLWKYSSSYVVTNGRQKGKIEPLRHISQTLFCDFEWETSEWPIWVVLELQWHWRSWQGLTLRPELLDLILNIAALGYRLNPRHNQTYVIKNIILYYGLVRSHFKRWIALPN
jgi:hypothetical protein